MNSIVTTHQIFMPEMPFDLGIIRKVFISGNQLCLNLLFSQCQIPFSRFFICDDPFVLEGILKLFNKYARFVRLGRVGDSNQVYSIEIIYIKDMPSSGAVEPWRIVSIGTRPYYGGYSIHYELHKPGEPVKICGTDFKSGLEKAIESVSD